MLIYFAVPYEVTTPQCIIFIHKHVFMYNFKAEKLEI